MRKSNPIEPVEYLMLFSNEGAIKVEVKFQDFKGTVAHQYMKPSEIIKLVSDEGEGFVTNMNFDDWPFQVVRYELDPIKNSLIIFAQKLPNTKES